MLDLQQWHTIDHKAEWGEGPWIDEPDKIQWIDPLSGLDCLVVRSPFSGSLCGYVGVPPTHPMHGREYSGESWDDSRSPEALCSVHGGLTYSGACQEGAPIGEGICHVPQPGRPEDVWWFGFDTAHFMDYAPAFEARMRELDVYESLRASDLYQRRYKPVSYVMDEVASLAAQLANYPLALPHG